MNALSCLGSGLSMPFLIIYLHAVRGISLPTAGLVLALIDRVGALRAFTGGLAVGGIGIAAFVFATSPATAVIPALVYGSASGLMWNGFATLLVDLVPSAERGSVFALRYMTANVAYGAGALVSGLLTVAKTPDPFPCFEGAERSTSGPARSADREPPRGRCAGQPCRPA